MLKKITLKKDGENWVLGWDFYLTVKFSKLLGDILTR